MNQLPATPLFLQIAATRVAFPGAEQASRMYRETIERYDRLTGRGGASTVPSCHIVTNDGTIVGYVSYNGKVWAGDPRNWQSGAAALFDPYQALAA